MHPTEEVLNDFADDVLEDRERNAVDRHLEACAECRAAVDGLRELRRAVGALEAREPPVRAWSRIERAIRLDSASRSAGVSRGIAPLDPMDPPDRHLATPRVQRWRLVWLGIAAAAVVVLAVSVTLRFGSHPAAPPSQIAKPSAPAPDSAQSVEAELRLASEHYEKAIKGLEQIANAEQGALDPRTAATLQKNLAVIDQAITESRTAIHAQPNSEPAQQSLIDNFKTKIGLLQDTVALINEMRKGNEAGAARIVSGLKQKG